MGSVDMSTAASGNFSLPGVPSLIALTRTKVATVRIFGIHVSSFKPNIESRDMSREHLLFRRVLKLATLPQTSKTDSETIISILR